MKLQKLELQRLLTERFLSIYLLSWPYDEFVEFR